MLYKESRLIILQIVQLIFRDNPLTLESTKYFIQEEVLKYLFS